MDVSAIVLNKLLTEHDLESWSKLKLTYLDPSYTSLYAAISRHYQDYNSLPTFDELEVTQRSSTIKNVLATVKLIDVPDVSIDVAINALIDQYTQNEAIKLLEHYIDNLTLYDTAEVKENLSSIVMKLDDKTHSSENVYNMSQIMLFRKPEELDRNRAYLGINNTIDAVTGGVSRQELILLGGKRGSGKSIVSSNIVVNQYEGGNTCAYFSIEMVAHETLERKLAMLARVNYQHLKQNKLTDSELLKVIQVRADMFEDSAEVVDDFLKHKDKYKFEASLIQSKKLKETNQMLIVDDRALSISSLDLHLSKFKAQFGDHFKMAVVDYLNQITLGSNVDMFDWKPQLTVSKQLKELARKHDITIISPYQIDDTGVARFSKGILDAADIALLLDTHDKESGAISFESTKIRSAGEMHFTSGIDWTTLRISPTDIETPKKAEKSKKTNEGKPPSGEPASDLPW